MNTRGWLAVSALLACIGAMPVRADVIRSPVAVVANTLGTAGGSTSHLIDGSGLSTGFISGETDFETYISLGPTDAAVSPTTGWGSTANTMPGYLEFDLGGVYTISAFVLWTQNNNLAVNSFSLSSALDSGFIEGVTELGGFSASVGLSAQTYAVSGVGEFVRLEIDSSHGLTQVNVGEVAFATVPEPASIAVLGMALATLGLVRRRR